MKMAVIFGIFHMSVGIIIKGTNKIYFKDYTGFFSEFLAGLIMLLFLFGWMDLLILFKFFKTYDID